MPPQDLTDLPPAARAAIEVLAGSRFFLYVGGFLRGGFWIHDADRILSQNRSTPDQFPFSSIHAAELG
jgi:hypothetical protein